MEVRSSTRGCGLPAHYCTFKCWYCIHVVYGRYMCACVCGMCGVSSSARKSRLTTITRVPVPDMQQLVDNRFVEAYLTFNMYQSSSASYSNSISITSQNIHLKCVELSAKHKIVFLKFSMIKLKNSAHT